MAEAIIGYLIVFLGIVSIFRPVILLYLFASVPIISMALTVSQYDTDFKILKVGSVNIYATDFLLIIMCVVFLLVIIKRIVLKTEPLAQMLEGPITMAICIFMIWQIIIGIISYTAKGFFIQNVLRQLSIEFMMFLAVFIPLIISNDKQKKSFCDFITIMCVFLVIVAAWRYFVSHNISMTSSETIRSISGNAVCIFAFSLCYSLFRQDSTKGRFIVSISIPALMIFGLVMAGHRSGLIVLLFILFAWYIAKKRGIKYFFLPLWGSAFFLIVLILPNMINMSLEKNFFVDIVKRFDDTFDLNNKTTVDRLDIWKYSVDILREKPIAGVASFPTYLKSHSGKDTNSPISQTQLDIPPHNMFVEKIIHEGIVGLGVLIYLLFIVFREIGKCFRFKHGHSLFYLIYLLSFLIFSSFNTTFSNTTGKTFLFIVIGFLNYDLKTIKNRNYNTNVL